MDGIAKYLAELINSQLDGTTASPIPQGITFEELSDIAKRNHMSYIIFSALMKSGSLDSEQYNYCRRKVFQSILVSSAQKNDYNRWVIECEKRGIVNQPMKGAIMKSYYPNTEMREMSDIDVLIGKDSMEAAGELLLNMGYELQKAIKHHDIYIKKPYMVVEAHRSMYDKHLDRNQYEYFDGFSKAELMENCKYTYQFTPEDFYIYMVAHAAKHFYEMGCGIRNLVDIYIYRKKFEGKLNQEYLDVELEKCGLTSFVKHMENLSFHWLADAPLLEIVDTGSKKNLKSAIQSQTEAFYNDLFKYMCDSGIYGKDANGIWNKFADEDASEATSGHLKQWYYFPPVSYMAKYYPWLEEHPVLLPAAWFIRFCRGVFLKKGENKRKMLSGIDEEEVKTYQRIYRNMNLKFKG